MTRPHPHTYRALLLLAVLLTSIALHIVLR
jgi:hypothetical protein